MRVLPWGAIIISAARYCKCHCIASLLKLQYSTTGVCGAISIGVTSWMREMKRQIAEKVLLMEPLSKEERNNMEIADKENDKTVVFINYSSKKGYGYHMIVSVRDDIICIHRGQTKRSDVFYRDNGLLEMIESIAES